MLADLPEETLVYPGRDFKGWPVSTLREERAFNPFMIARDLEEFIALKDLQEPSDLNPLVEKDDIDDDLDLEKKTDIESLLEFDSKLPSWR